VTVASPAYLQQHGRPTHPHDLTHHACFSYAYARSRDTWHFENAAGEKVAVRLTCRMRVNNGDAALPAVIAGLGIAALPDFIVRPALAAGQIEAVLPEWSGQRSSLHLVTVPTGPRPARVQVLADFLVTQLSAA
jgi:DNA-binding transcriptional LysR family regulator